MRQKSLRFGLGSLHCLCFCMMQYRKFSHKAFSGFVFSARARRKLLNDIKVVSAFSVELLLILLKCIRAQHRQQKTNNKKKTIPVRWSFQLKHLTVTNSFQNFRILGTTKITWTWGTEKELHLDLEIVSAYFLINTIQSNYPDHYPDGTILQTASCCGSRTLWTGTK